MDDRSWMYRRLDVNKRVTNEFFEGVHDFILRAQMHTNAIGESSLILCPCSRCRNIYPQESDVVHEHLVRQGFVQNYYRWEYHGENVSSQESSGNSSMEVAGDEYHEMVGDGMGFGNGVNNYVGTDHVNAVEAPNAIAAAYYKLLHDADEPVYEGCTTMSILALMSQLVNLKSESGISTRYHERYVSVMQRLTPDKGLNIPSTYYQAKKKLMPLCLPHQKIDACVDNCMLFYGDAAKLKFCSQCGKSRYKREKGKVAEKVLNYFPIGPRLQRLYMSGKTTKHMTWHHRNPSEDGVMTHPSHGGAWKHFDTCYPEFASEPRNVRIGLCTDGFNPFGQFARNYSCWPVMVCVYNLPPGLCMKDPYIFLALLIPGPRSPGRDLDVFLRPLIDELNHLWGDGVVTFDADKNINFTMRVTLMWTISDFPAYGMLSGWSTHGKLACPYCMNETDTHYLPTGKKVCWFDCHRKFLRTDHPDRRNRVAFVKGRVVDHVVIGERLSGSQTLNNILQANPPNEFGESNRKRKSPGYGTDHHWTKKSIFWELPYWKDNLIRHNLDLMHIEKNGLENLMFTTVDVKSKTKDNAKSREDMVSLCSRSHLHLLDDSRVGKIKPKAKYVLTRDQQERFHTWLANLKLPDGCASNLSRCTSTNGFAGLKSHDCHVLMEKLLPVAFRHLLPNSMWEAVVEWCHFFRDLCSSTLRVEHLLVLERNIPEITCNLEKIYPPAFFDVMEHLPIHLPYEAINGGPCQYRWMYPFESYLGKLKHMVTQKAYIEGSIAQAYLLKEVSSFCAMYFDEGVQTNQRQPPRNDDGGEVEVDERLSIFRHPGRPTRCKRKLEYLTDEESNRLHIYVLENTEEVATYRDFYKEQLSQLNPNCTAAELHKYFIESFGPWLEEYVALNIHMVDPRISTLSSGPYSQIRKFVGYYTNGYLFDTKRGQGRKTNNSGVMVEGTYTGGAETLDYYGEIAEIWEVSYVGVGESIVFFKCDWFSNDKKNMRVHPTNGLIEIRRKSRMSLDDPFILASQARQVYFLEYVSKEASHKEWIVVCKTRARNRIDMTHVVPTEEEAEVLVAETTQQRVFQESEMPPPVPLQPHLDLNDPSHLVDPGHYEVVEVQELQELQELQEHPNTPIDESEDEFIYVDEGENDHVFDDEDEFDFEDDEEEDD